MESSREIWNHLGSIGIRIISDAIVSNDVSLMSHHHFFVFRFAFLFVWRTLGCGGVVVAAFIRNLSSKRHASSFFTMLLMKQVVSSVLAPALVALSIMPEDVPLIHVLPTTNSESSTGACSSSSSTVLAATTTSTASSSSATNKSPTEDYLPRRLYPGTYGQFCGPTPVRES